MQTIILVDGSVTAKQYEQVRFEALRQGIKPKILRMQVTSSGLSIWGKYIFGCLDIDITDDTVDYYGDVAEKVSEMVEHEELNLFAIIASERTHYYDGAFSFTKILQRLEQDFQYWVVRKDGQLEFC